MVNPIAVIGLGLRFPGGANSPESFWKLLMDGRDAVTELEPDRWDIDRFYHPRPGTPGKAYTRAAGQLDDIWSFDADFFGISPREAGQIDPQQRLLLEMTWEAFEDARIAPSTLRGSNTGVFVGISSTDAAGDRFDDPASGNAYFMTGCTLSIAANRISYVFDLHGPSMAIDTACSSSLVALHQACQTLWAGTSSMVVCGGVNVLLSPFPYVGFSQASMLSPDGRCKAFDASGHGYVRSEGGAVVLLKPLSQAERDGDPVRAVIIDAASNCDGRTAGISLPNTLTQQALLRGVYERSGVDPAAISYIEMHGTGTAVGDPAEAIAVGEVIGRRRAASSPLLIGSVKTNIGHLESGSGMAGLAKAILCVENRRVPPSLHFDTPNPNIPFDELNLRVVTEATALPGADSQPARVGVNSFGFGGANAHVLLESHPPGEASVREPACEPRLTAGYLPPLAISARSESSLAQLALDYRQRLLADPASCVVIARAAALHREHHPFRLAAIGESGDEVAAALESFADGEPGPNICNARCHPASGKAVGVFSGNGAQWVGMGRRLLAMDDSFRRYFSRVDAALSVHTGWSVADELAADDDDSRLSRTDIAQPALFAIQVALWEVLRERGAEFEAVLGHSVGEVAAAWAAGVLDLPAAAEVICQRSRFQEQTRGLGRMAAMGLAKVAASDEIANFDGRVELAAVNSPGGVTVSGPLEDLRVLEGRMAERGVFFRILDLEYAFHSRAMDGIETGLKAELAHLVPTRSRLRFVSTVTGDDAEGFELGASYWWENVRRPVRFRDAVSRLAKEGYGPFVEIGPHAILQFYLNETLRDSESGAAAIAILDRNEPEELRLARATGLLYVNGARLDFARLYQGVADMPVALPRYPWHRTRHHYDPTAESRELLHGRRVHPFLGWRRASDAPEWEAMLDTVLMPWLDDHRVGGTAMFPAAGFIETALAAAREVFGEAPSLQVARMDIVRPLELAADASRVITVKVADGVGSFEISSRGYLESGPGVVHATGRLRRGTLRELPPPDERVLALRRDALPLAGDRHYAAARQLGLEYGEVFRTVVESRSDGDRAWTILEAPRAHAGTDDGLLLHPAVLDGCFQTLFAVLARRGWTGEDGVFLPTSFESTTLLRAGVAPRYCATHLARSGARSVVADFDLYDAELRPVARLESCRFRRMDVARRQSLPGIYEFATVLCDAPDSSMVAAATTSATARDAIEGVSFALDDEVLSRYGQARERLDALVAAFATEALSTFADVEGAIADNAIDAAGGRAGRTLVHQLLELSGARPCQGDENEGWRLSKPASSFAAATAWRELLGDCPALLPELTLVGRIGRNLVPLLRGEVEASEILSPRGSAVAGYLDTDSLGWSGLQRATGEAVAAAGRAWRGPERMKVLHIGPGEPALVRRFLDCLPADAFDYVFAGGDDGASAIEVDFNGDPRVSTWSFAPDALPDPGENTGKFDLVIAWNPAARGMRADDAAGWLGQLAAPGGTILVAGEADTPATRLLQAVRALDRGSVEPVAPRVAHAEAWRRQLEEYGFDAVELLAARRLPLGSGFLLGAWREASEVPLAMGLEANQARETVLVLSRSRGESAAVAGALVEALKRSGHPVRWACASVGGQCQSHDDCTSPIEGTGREDFTRLFSALNEGNDSPRVIVDLLRVPADGVTPPTAESATPSLALMNLAQAIAATWQSSPPRIVLVTAGALNAHSPSCTPSPAQWAAAGLRRVIANEHYAMRSRTVDLPNGADDADTLDALVREIEADDDEDEVVLVEGRRYGARLRPLAASRLAESSRTDGDGPVALDFDNPGSFDNLTWREVAPLRAGAGQIVVDVRASGLNFRDVMWAMGLLQDEAVEDGFAGASLGMECAGIVLEVGEDVIGFAPGDPVVCFAPRCLASRVLADTNAAARIPAGLDFAQAATIPTAFFTVYYALDHLATLEPKERILIHGAAGGVGLAAIQYARHVGAEIFATAGSEEKRDFLRLLGVDNVYDSRSLDFADAILADTGGSGVDVVLNSLAGEAIERNLRVLRPFGRFLELGKRDFYLDSKIGLRPFRNNLSYFGIDADQLMARRPALTRRLFREMMTLFDSGVFKPLPYRLFGFSRVRDAFTTMQQSRHIGKLILAPDDAGAPRSTAASVPRVSIDPEGVYVISGGFGGFGLATAHWLAEKGARHLVALGRSGAGSTEALDAIAALGERGVSVDALAVDVIDDDALSRALEDVRRAGRVIRGAVHAAMVLDDGLVRNLDEARFARVFDAKAVGAWNLHQATLDDPLDFFVLYSSATSCLGSAGQGNYVAGNAYLEGLAAYRHALGRPALAVAWGSIGDVGVLARDEELRASLAARTGFRPLASRSALDVMDRLIGAGRPHAAVMELDWNVIRKALPGARAARFREVLAAAGAMSAEDGASFRERIAGLDAAALRELVIGVLREQVGKVLRIAADRIDPDLSLQDMGMDSLMAVELALEIEKYFGIPFSSMSAAAGGSLSSTAGRIVAALAAGPGDKS